MGLSADALVPCPPERPKYRTKVKDFVIVRSGGFFARHQDYFIVTRNFPAVYLGLLPFRSFTVTLGFAGIYRVPIAPDSYRDGRQKTRHRDPSLSLWAGSGGT
jgi:hypothetical protein